MQFGDEPLHTELKLQQLEKFSTGLFEYRSIRPVLCGFTWMALAADQYAIDN